MKHIISKANGIECGVIAEAGTLGRYYLPFASASLWISGKQGRTSEVHLLLKLHHNVQKYRDMCTYVLTCESYCNKQNAWVWAGTQRAQTCEVNILTYTLWLVSRHTAAFCSTKTCSSNEIVPVSRWSSAPERQVKRMRAKCQSLWWRTFIPPCSILPVL